MRIDVIGGGAAGLYSAILLKKSFPAATIQVVERNRPEDTFGFGIVLSDETLGNLRDADGAVHYPAMTAVQVVALMAQRARLEIEVTAVVPMPM